MTTVGRIVAALAVAGAVACALSSCGGAAAAPDAALLLVEPWAGGPLSLRVAGVIDHQRPVPHGLTRPWIPLESLVQEGDEVAVGDPIVHLDQAIVQKWSDRDALQLDEQVADGQAQVQRAAQRLADLRAREATLAGQAGVLDAEIAATRRRDDQQIRIARLELANAEAAATRASDRRDRVRALAASGFASPAELTRAENDADLAGADVALPRLRLDLAEHGSTALTRRGKELDLAKQQADLAGVRAQIRALSDATAGKDADLGVLKAMARRWDEVLADPTVRATAAGRVRYRNDSVRPGAKLSLPPLAFTLDDDGLIADVALPDRWRSLIRAGEDAVATVSVPALSATLPGRIQVIGAAPEPSADGTGRVFRCQVALLAPDDRLRPGMAVEVELAVDPGQALAVIPTWCVADLRHPAVDLADGSRREISGFPVAHRFVVLSGLAAGERLRLRDAAPVGGTRLVGVLAPERAQTLRANAAGNNLGWQIIEVVPDGTLATAGQVVARQVRDGAVVEDVRLECERNELQAASRLADARRDAEASIAQALSTWRQSVQAAERARLELYITGLGGSITAEAAAQAALVRAEVARRKALARSRELEDPAAAAGYSRNDGAARALALAQAELALSSARLAEVVARRSLDHLALREARAAVSDAEERALLDRIAYGTATIAAQNRVAGALNAWGDESRRLAATRDQMLADAIRAPRDGRVYHRVRDDGRPLRIGDRVDGQEPLIMPIGRRRQFALEVPARWYGRFRAGESVRFVLPTLSSEPRDGAVTAVAAFLGDPRDAKAERAVRGAVGVAERVFTVIVGFELTDEEIERAPLGSTAYVDL